MAEEMKKMCRKVLHVNGNEISLVVDSEDLLSNVIRKQLGLTGTKVGCKAGQCGICSVILNGKVVRSCVVKMKKVENGSIITTIEGVGNKDHMHPLQLAFAKHGSAQCGFCTPGFIVWPKGCWKRTSHQQGRK